MSEQTYEYDVFISYPHHYKQWVTEIFVGFFGDSVCEALGKEPNIFIDTDKVLYGDNLQSRLQRGLARAKVFVPVLGVRYFQSIWCVAECAAILHRQSQQNAATVNAPPTLIFPVQLEDGKHIPQLLKEIFRLNCNKFNYTNEAFRNCPEYNNLKDYIKDNINPVVDQLRNISVRDPHWENIDYIRQAYNKYKDILLANFPAEQREKFPPADTFLKAGHDDYLQTAEKFSVPMM